MKTSWPERIRVFLLLRVLTGIYGMTMGDWSRLLWKRRFAIDPPYWPRAAFTIVASLANSALSWRENRVYGPKLKDLSIQPPIILLGHWRSGTTYLHNLLAADERFAYPNVYQTTNPLIFLSTERVFKVFGLFSPQTRIIDNVDFGFDVPFEDEFATCSATFLSPYMGWVFPRCEDYFDRYLTFREVSDAEIERWKAALILFLRKLTWKYNRPLVLKSPPHTCRIKLLLEMFPDARFIHIHRNPFSVFQSTRRLMELMYRVTRLQRSTGQDVDARIIQRYQVMHDAFFEEREMIPDGQFHEVSYQELVSDPMAQMAIIYERLNLPDFAAVQPSLQRYIGQIAGYRKSEYSDLPSSLRGAITQAWRRSFQTWGYQY